ncbi:FxLD family lanthipeptide [Saccharothrix sp. BKS2]|uniref:FxLD family lanthipeptide n=1 Tax=Saccharothrix xinjiangensis TaxID=204798 RepID=A0ABV9YE31_9PSEU
MTTTEMPTHDDPFALDLRVITDMPADPALNACTNGTDDGCDPTCASACVTGGV